MKWWLILILLIVLFFALFFTFNPLSKNVGTDESVSDQLNSNQSAIENNNEFIAETPVNTNDTLNNEEIVSSGICPLDNLFLHNLVCECPDEYTKIGWSLGGKWPNGTYVWYYCDINKDWQDFERCNSETDCTVPYVCVARYNYKNDLRCSPPLYRETLGARCDLNGVCGTA